MVTFESNATSFSAPSLHFYRLQNCLYFNYGYVRAENSSPRRKFRLVENTLYPFDET